ncbi:putative ribonuclease H-like domain-containing protein [Tanacetum coccineum]
MTGNKSYLLGYEEIDGGFVAFGGDPKEGRITGKGKISTGKLDFEDVYFVKELKFNLFSVSQMCDKKISVLFTNTECVALYPDFKLLDENHVLLRVPRKDNMYSVDLKNIVPLGGLTCLFGKAILDESNLWHRRLGHINFKTMNKLVRGNLVKGLPLKIFENNHTCVACQKGKQHEALVTPRLLMKKMYCLVVTDDYSRFSWVFFLATEDETSEIHKTFITGIENLIDLKVKVIRCDNGTEFKNKVMNHFCEMNGIKREFSVARTPQQNVVAERKNRTLIEAARTMLADSKLPTTFWAEVVNTACYVQNRVLVINPHNKTPYELFLGKKPALSFMRPFGCPVTILNTLDHLGQARKKIVPNLKYILLPLLTSDPSLSKSSRDSPNAGIKPLGEEEKIDVEHPENEDNEVPNTEEPRVNQEKDESINSTNNINTVSSTVNTASIEDNVVNENIIYGCIDDPNMPNLEEIVYSDDDEEVGAEADINNLATTVLVSPILTKRVHKDHPLKQIIGDIHSAPQTRRMTKNVTEHGLFSSVQQRMNHKDFQNCMFVCFSSQAEPKNEIQALQDPSWIKDMQEELLLVWRPLSTYLLENGFRRGTIDKTLFIKKDKDDAQEIPDEFYGGAHFLLRVAETNKALLKDEEAANVDVHLYRSMIGSLMYLTASRSDIMFAICACARFQVTPKTSHLHAVKRIFRYLKGHPKLGLWKAKRTTEISQSSRPIPLVSDENVIKEWEDIMERDVTTASEQW